MSENKMKELAQLAIAAVRALYGDYSGVIAQGLKYLPKILAIVISMIFVIVVLPTMFIQSLFIGSTPSGTFGELAVESLKYKEDWVTVLALAQTKKTFLGRNQADLAQAAQALNNKREESYLITSSNSKKEEWEIYQRNLKLLQNLLSSYAGYVYFYDEIPQPESYSNIKKVFSKEYGYQILVDEYMTDQGTAWSILYAANDVVNFKLDEKKIKIKYRKYTLKAFFPIPQEYGESFTNDFGSDRNNDGQRQGHEGIDIFAVRNTPVLAVEDCSIRKIGWNGLGGWRILLESKDGLRQYYYAHLERYVDRLQKYQDRSGKVAEKPGVEVKAGEVVGFVGSSGSFESTAKPGADTGTPPHLHFQLWVIDRGWFSEKETLINPYYSLKLLENNRYSEEYGENQAKLAKEGL